MRKRQKHRELLLFNIPGEEYVCVSKNRSALGGAQPDEGRANSQ